MYDVVIIGGGIIGSFLAHDLSRYQLSIAVLEKDSDIANETTMANSAIIHSGHDPKEGTLKEKLNLQGNLMYEKVCEDLQVTFQKTSAFVVATSSEEIDTLETLVEQAKKRKIPVSVFSGDKARELEPNLSDGILQVAEFPTTGIIYPWEVSLALMEEALLNGTELFLNQKVSDIKTIENGFQIKTQQGKLFEAKYVLNAAGVYADEIYQMISENKQKRIQITPRKGEYFVLDKQNPPLVNRVIYPVPSSLGKGVLCVPTIHGNFLLGPNSSFVEEKEDISSTKDALAYVKKEISKIMKNVPFDQIIRTFSGLRASGVEKDFVIEEASDIPCFINIAQIESPGLASAPAISDYVIHEILEKKKTKKLEFNKKSKYIHRRPWISLKEMELEEKNKLVKENPAFGTIVCRCEQITEGEILDAIHRPLGATTVKGVKKRVRPGMGRCQGGFCEPKIVDILARELNISPLEVRLDAPKSFILLEETKGGKLS